jgi:Glyoxalase-like domain
MDRRTSLLLRRCSAAVFVLTLFSLPSMSQDNKTDVLELDHVSVCGSNLNTLQQMFTDVGLTPDFGGPHGNGVTQMAAIGFDDGTYIELIAPVKVGATAGSQWAKFMGEDAVTCAWAVGTNVILQEVDRLKKAGIGVTTPERGSRKRPDGMSVE